MMKEKRKNPRSDALLAVDYSETPETVHLFYETRNISRDGAFVVTDNPLSQGSKIELVLSLVSFSSPESAKAPKQIVVHGKVARVQPSTDPLNPSASGMGIEFVDMNDKTWDLIHHYLQREKDQKILKLSVIKESKSTPDQLREIQATQKKLKKEFEMFWKDVTK